MVVHHDRSETMNRYRKEHDNKWYEITLKDESVKLVKGQQSIPAVKRKYKGQIRSIRRISMQGLQGRQKERLGNYIAFLDLEYNTGDQNKYPTEIISVGILIVERKSMKEKESYYSLVRPKFNTVLNPYCMELTGLRQVEVDHAPGFGRVFREVLDLYRKWNIRQTFVFGSADKPVFLDNLLLNEEEEELYRIGEGMRDISLQLFFTLFGKDGSLSLEKMGRILNVSVDGALHNALNDARLLYLCYRAVIKGEIPQDRLSVAREELLIREVYQKSRKFEEPMTGYPEEKKQAAYALIGELMSTVKTDSLREKGKVLALCDDILLMTGEKARYQREYFHWI